MKKHTFYTISLMTLAVTFTGCDSSSNDTTSANNNANQNTMGLSAATRALGINAIPNDLSAIFTSALKFDRYTKVNTPNGRAIHILAQDEISDNQIVRARSILEHFLTDLPGSEYGEDKSAVANKMADNNAKLLLLNGVDDGTNPASELDGQPLYFGEIQVEGHNWYIQQDYNHRDAAFEEILHLVHDYGIGVDQNEIFYGALPNFQDEIRAAQINASADNLWGTGATEWIAELTTENSLSQEYLAAIIDVYYGLWGADTESNTHGMHGLYVSKVREDISIKDPYGATLLDNKFFHPYLTYNARIDDSFTGDFSLIFNVDLPYTYHAQYLKDITLTGTNNSNVILNQMDNHITGNQGINTVVMSGPSSEYDITQKNNHTIIEDMRDNRDGKNTLQSIEKIQFTDTTIDIF